MMSETPFDDPFEWFGRWFDAAEQAVEVNPNAMGLGTVSKDGQPSIRQVLLKSFDRQGFVFYTNYRSHKAAELDQNRRVALNFYWRAVRRQVRIEGAAERISAAESEAYFASRSRGSQIGAWASRQSRPLGGRAELAARVDEFEQKFRGRPVPRPDHWGGYRVAPVRFEFWLAQDDRLHDRWTWVRSSPTASDWQVQMLFP